jgi:hypothetical protein
MLKHHAGKISDAKAYSKSASAAVFFLAIMLLLMAQKRGTPKQSSSRKSSMLFLGVLRDFVVKIFTLYLEYLG